MKPLVVVWRITERCNLSCPFCAYDRSILRARNEADEKLIEQFASILAKWKEATGRPVLLSWLGGEPFLWPALGRLSEKFHRDYGFSISTTTNGTMLGNDRVRDLLMDHFAEVTLSVDGPAETHDALRGRPGLHAQVCRSINQLATAKKRCGHGPVLRANVLLLRETIAGFPALCRELGDWGIEEISCNQLGGLDRPEFYPAHRLLAGQIAELTEGWSRLRDELAPRGVNLLGSFQYLRRLAATAAGERWLVEDCGPGRDFLFITEKGLVAPCSFTVEEYGVDLREFTSPADIDALPARFHRRRQTYRAAHCEDCHSTQVCEKFVA
jgi:radical SAM protein with 4Fe4S-binding SPASM domain